MDNVVKFPGVEEIEMETITEYFGKKLDVENIIEGVRTQEFDDVILIGAWHDRPDQTYFASTTGNPAEVLWQLKKAEHMLMLSYFASTENPYGEEE